MRNLRDEARWIIGEIDEAKRLAKAVGKPQLGTSSIEAGRVEEYDQDGALVQIIGEQYDGTHAPVTVNGPPPPEPAGLSLTVGVGSVEARWNGKFAGDAVSPMDFSHVSLHGSRPEVFTPSNETQLATIAGELGDVATVILEPGEWTFGLVAVSKAGKWSELSETVTVEIPDYPTAGELQDELIGLGTAVDGKITVEIRPPSIEDGDGKPVDALWNELDPVTREQVAVWRWTGEAWEEMPLSETIIPKISIAEGTYGRLRGVQLEADAVDGMVITGATVQTDRDPAKGMKLDNAGLRAYGPEGGEPVAEIRPNGGTVYQVSDPTTGEVLGGIDSEGGLSGTNLTVSGEARIDGVIVAGGDPLTPGHAGDQSPGEYGPVFNHRSLFGIHFMNYIDQHPNVTDNFSWLTAIPYGMVLNTQKADPSLTWDAIGGQHHYKIRLGGTIETVAGRLYQVNYGTPAMRATDGGSGNLGEACIVRSNDGGSITAGGAEGYKIPASKESISNSGEWTSINRTTLLRCPEDIPAGKIMLGIELYVNSGRKATTTSNEQAATWSLSVLDMGLHYGPYNGTPLYLDKKGTEPTPTPPPPEPARPRQYTDTVSASWWQAYTGDNTQATHSTYSGAAAQGRTPYAPGNGVMRGLIGFPSQASRLSGATVKKIEVYVYAKSWHANAGGTAVLGVHGHDSKPGNWSSTSNDVKRQKMKRPEGRWITLPSSVHAGFKSGSLRGISFYPPSGSTSTEYYGIFTGNKTRLRVTYTK